MKTKYYLTNCSVTSWPASPKNISSGVEYNAGIFKFERGSLKACCTSEGTVISSKMTNYILHRTNDSLNSVWTIKNYILNSRNHDVCAVIAKMYFLTVSMVLKKGKGGLTAVKRAMCRNGIKMYLKQN